MQENIEIRDLSLKVLASVYPWLVVNYDLDELFISEPHKAREIILDKLKKEKIFDKKGVMVIKFDYLEEREKLKGLIIDINESDFKSNSEMYLFKAVSLLEAMINIWCHDELIFKEGIDTTKANSILNKLSTKEKMDWLLILLTNESFVHHPSWNKIKYFIKLRNYFIHFKSYDADEQMNYRKSLTKENFLEFLDASDNCFSFLMERQNEEHKEILCRINKISNIFNSRIEELHEETVKA